MQEDKNIIEELNEISENERFNEALHRLPVVGVVKNGVTILPDSEKDGEEDFWEEVYNKQYGKQV